MKTALVVTFALFLHAITAAGPQKPASPAPRFPFRIVFVAYAGDPQRDKPEAMDFDVKTLDLRQPVAFSRLGDRIPNTKLQLTKFSHKSRKTPDGKTKDVSELTLTNVETQETAILILAEPQDIAAIAGVRRP